MSEKIKAKFLYVDNGFCRVVYEIKSKTSNLRYRYCLQIEDSKGETVIFYDCHNDWNEPSSAKKTNNVLFEAPPQDTITGKQVYDFLVKNNLLLQENHNA